MKIKTTKKLNLPELIQYVWENDIRSETLESKFGVEVRLGGNQAVIMNHPVGIDDTFTVEVEEELTEDTVIQGLADVFFDPLIGGPNVEYHTDCIKNIKQGAMETYSLAIFYKDTLIWSSDSGIPADGVLEVDAE